MFRERWCPRHVDVMLRAIGGATAPVTRAVKAVMCEGLSERRAASRHGVGGLQLRHCLARVRRQHQLCARLVEGGRAPGWSERVERAAARRW